MKENSFRKNETSKNTNTLLKTVDLYMNNNNNISESNEEYNYLAIKAPQKHIVIVACKRKSIDKQTI